MSHYMHWVDWVVIAAYLVGLMGFAIYLARGQHDRKDYYLGAQHMGAWPIAISIMATQCSTNSILGAPAFVGFAADGGLSWLQYELAIPLAMLVLIIFFIPALRQSSSVSIYSFLEQRFDIQTRLLLSGLFLFVRAFATAVTVYSIALVVDLITGVGFFGAVLLLGVFTVVYDVFGGMRGVVYSDVLQMLILVCVLIVVFVFLLFDTGGLVEIWKEVPEARLESIDFAHHGFGDGETFAFWPMLFGGLFLYVAYYGCDQSQAQRLLSTENTRESQRALMLNGLLRFPLVALYCVIGLGLAAYALARPEFVAALPKVADQPQFNLVVPLYMLQSLPIGVVGLALVALFAAAMSSLDSVINSLSATTLEDFVRRFYRAELSLQQEIRWSRWITAFWGILTLLLAFTVENIAPTVLEAINKIGSLSYGPILAVFICGYFLGRVTAIGVKVGFVLGVLSNVLAWVFWPELSWLWWNVSGCLVALLIAVAVSYLKQACWPVMTATLRDQNLVEIGKRHSSFQALSHGYIKALLLWFFVLFGGLWLLSGV